MKEKIFFDYYGVLYYYFMLSKESSITKAELDGIADFVTGYLFELKRYKTNPNVSFYLEANRENLERKLSPFSFLWCGDPKTKHSPKTEISDETYTIGCDDFNALSASMLLFVITKEKRARKDLEEGVQAYLDFKKEQTVEGQKKEPSLKKKKLVKPF